MPITLPSRPPILAFTVIGATAPASAESAPAVAPSVPPQAPLPALSLVMQAAATTGGASAGSSSHAPLILLATIGVCWLVPRASWSFILAHRRSRAPPARPPFSPG